MVLIKKALCFGRRLGPQLRSRAGAIAAAYAVFATLWIYFSDQALGILITNPEWLVRVSVYKGLVFVLVTSLLLFLLMRRVFGALEAGYAALQAQEKEIDRLQRLYAALTQINQAIVRLPTREELFVKVCELLVERGGFCMAWIGWHDAETQRITPVAASGEGRDYLGSLNLSSDANLPEGRGPSGVAVRTGQPCICHDMLNEPVLRPWQAEIRKRGFRGAAVFPIRYQGQVRATLSVYATVPKFFQDKEIALLVGAAADVSYALDNFARETERRQAEAAAQNEKRFSETMIESMPGIVYFYDQLGGFLRWNRNFETVSGYTAAEIARLHPLDFFRPEDQALVRERIGEVFTKGESSVVAPFRSKQGHTTPYFLTGRTVNYQGQPCLVGVGIDISDRVQAEHALQVLNQTLELEVANRTVELQTALARAETADRIKSAFLATMSHELRTPLNSIIGFTGIVLQGLAGPLNPEQTKQLTMVRGSARHLLELINDVLDISKIEAGQLEVRAESFDLAASLERVVASVKPLADKKELQLRTSIPHPLPAMVSDRRRVEQILLNLLNNALKFTDQGEVHLTVELLEHFPASAAPPGRAAVRLRVTDTGIGIKPEDLALLFQPFRQLDTGLTRQHEGTGLGLAICRRLATLLGGEISATSEWQRGSEFIVTLPLLNPD